MAPRTSEATRNLALATIAFTICFTSWGLVAPLVGAPVMYQLHATAAWLILLVWPFTRLVHAWSIPLQYVGRPYILYRRRWAPAPRRR